MRFSKGNYVLGALLLVLVGSATAQTRSPKPVAGAVNVNTSEPPATPNLLGQLEDQLAQIAERALACVVTIEGETVRDKATAPGAGGGGASAGGNRTKNEKERPPNAEENNKDSDDEDDVRSAVGGLTGDFLGSTALGSGFLVASGFVVTTAEVATRIKSPSIVFADGKRVKAEWVNADTISNIAVIKIKDVAPNLGLRWGDSARVQPGHIAILVAKQGGFENSVALGLVAGKGRAGRSGTFRYTNLLQFQGTVGQGASGTALLNSQGDVMGMVVATPDASTMSLRLNPLQGLQGGQGVGRMFSIGASNVGFALPANEVRRIVETLARRQQPTQRKGWIGISLNTLFENGKAGFARINGVYVGGPAEKAGLRGSDLVESMNGTPTRSTQELRNLLQSVRTGEALRMMVVRGQKRLTITVTVEARPSDSAIEKTPLRDEAPPPG